MKQQLTTMLNMQDAMNTKVHPQWRGQNFEWYRAIWVECAELMDHYGWKWWKKQSPDTDQVVLELIDIWHFGLSIVLTEYDNIDAAVLHLEQGLDLSTPGGDFKQDLETFAADTLASKSFSLASFSRLLVGMDVSFDELFRRYVGKNVLNFFRQDHGYKDGSYRKLWSGREDNEHLVEALETLDASSDSFKDALYAALEQRYHAN